MPRNSKAPESEGQGNAIQEWVSAGFKSLIVCVISMGVFVFNSNSKNTESAFVILNQTLKELNLQLKTMESHQVETDKRVQAIEVARELNQTSYQKLITDVGDLKMQVTQLTMRIQTMSDFIVKRVK